MDTITVKKEKRAYSYEGFVALSRELLDQGKTTGTNHSEDLVRYTTLNFKRMNRIYKTTELTAELEEKVKSIDEAQTWLVLVEAWCGDVAQNLPVIAKAAALNPLITLELVLRDENLDVMDKYLTNGGRAIPKFVMLDGETREELAEWGPRPAPAQAMVREYKKLEEKPPYSEFVIEIQKWYAKDKTKSLQGEIGDMIGGLKSVK